MPMVGVQLYTELIYSVAEGADLRTALKAAAKASSTFLKPLDLEKVLASGLDDVRVVHRCAGCGSGIYRGGQGKPKAWVCGSQCQQHVAQAAGSGAHF